ncbi:unnamed protein product [Caenorhabditis bovis]|uniref:PKD/REJ-like domain-containing protein n=1 Tax=Caenorhabditis bovis TaxID=2654633 RepID=A0A8S1FG01_9PELO|nr:unnamed protein product [Caenorhabditis bovis]
MMLILLLIFLHYSDSNILENCYSTGYDCFSFKEGFFELASNVTLTADDVPTAQKDSNFSTRIIINDILQKLTAKENVSIAALVLEAGNQNEVVWKISPDLESEHLIKIDKSTSTDIPYSIYGFDILNYNEGSGKLLVIPPNVNLFFTRTAEFHGCQNNSLILLPFIWNEESRNIIKGVSYLSLTECNTKCISLPIPTQLLRMCPNVKFKPTVHIDRHREFEAQISDDLLGFTIKVANKSMEFPIGILDCASLFENVSILGEAPFCLGDGKNVAIKFGASPIYLAEKIVRTKKPPSNIYVRNPSAPIYPNFTVSYESEIGQCRNIVRFEVKQISGSGLFPLTFKWTVINGTKEMERIALSTNNRVLEFQRIDLLPKNTLMVTVCNIADKCTSVNDIDVTLIDDSSVFSVAIEGYEKISPTSFGLQLRAMPSFQSCNASIIPREVQYEWIVNGESSTFDDLVKLPAYKYKVNENVNITLIAKYNREKFYSSTDSKTIQYVGLPLLLGLDCAENHFAHDHELIIHAIAFDPNQPHEKLLYKWDCHLLNESSEVSKKCDVTGINWKRKSLRIPAGKLKQFQRIQALVNPAASKVNITWEIVQDSNYAYFNLSSINAHPTTILDNLNENSQVAVSLIIPPASQMYPGWLGLLAGKTFLIRLWATNSRGTSFADLHLHTNSPPQKGAIDVTSTTTEFTALDTPIKLSIGDGWTDDIEDLPLSYTFGLKTLFENGSDSIQWLRKSTAKTQMLYLPTASKSPKSTCDGRIGYTAVLKVCDRLESCTEGESDKFEVMMNSNLTVSVAGLISRINADIANGNFMSAIDKINSINIETCVKSFDIALTDKVALLLIQSLDESTESLEFQEAIKSALTLLPVVSSDVLTELISTLESYRILMGHSGRNRQKRAATLEEETIKVYQATESEANDMLKVYDILIGKDKPVIDVFFLNINDFLTGLCVQLDENSDRAMSATGSGYTEIRSQSINANLETYTGLYNISGNPMPKIHLTSTFADQYRSWTCGTTYTSTCLHICLGSAWISQTAMFDNSFLATYLFDNQYYLNANRSVSDLYQISFIDPLSGNIVRPASASNLFSVAIPLYNYNPIDYYECFLFNQHIGWQGTSCSSPDYAVTKDNVNYMVCNCTMSGIVGVFHVNPPTPAEISNHNEIQVLIELDVQLTSNDVSKFFYKLAQLSEIDLRRFVKLSNKENKTISAVLRPLFLSTHQSNSYALQAIKKALGYEKMLSNVNVEKFSYKVIQRDLQGDRNARKIRINLNQSYANALRNESDEYAKKWTQNIANMLQISEYRLKNAKIFFGVVFNFTVTVPFSDEVLPLTADEISLMIQEASVYGELQFSVLEETVHVNPIKNTDIFQLLVIKETNSLMIAIIVALSAILGIGTLFIGGAVIVKIKTDKLIEEERRRAILGEVFRVPPPEYDNVSSTPAYQPTTVAGQYPHRRNRLETRHY